ncbi:MAG: hypothetical protein M1127_03130 [Patescibacteria group bacterium]|nr:hypothetical protein [Patescibacteria group bacterium]
MARKFSQVSVEILKILAVMGMFAIAAGSPHFWIKLSRSLRQKNKYLRTNYSQAHISRILSRLKRTQMVVLKKKDGEFIVRISDKGKKRIQQIVIDDLKNKKPKQWDGVWRVVIFDIPEWQRYGRAALRWKMKDLGFYQLQKSVWVFPYDCEKEIELLANFFAVYEYVNFIEAKRISDSEKLKKFFCVS